jgi:hypothetical protein
VIHIFFPSKDSISLEFLWFSESRTNRVHLTHCTSDSISVLDDAAVVGEMVVLSQRADREIEARTSELGRKFSLKSELTASRDSATY